jgi:hypothetical protein
MKLTIRKGSLGDLATELQEQQDRKVDLVVPASKLWSHNGDVVLVGQGEPLVTADGVTETHRYLTPSDTFDDGMVGKLYTPGRPLGRAFVRGLRETGRTDILDSIYNGLLHGSSDLAVPGDNRKFFVRTFSGQDDKPGYARALLSDKYRPIDNLDVLLTVIKGLQNAGFGGHVVRQADLSDHKMYLRISVPEITALAPGLLHGYRSPFGGARGSDNPVVEAGLVITNSETGGAAFTITPELVVQICTNGMTIKKDMIRKPHLGAKMDEGVRTSQRTLDANKELVAAQTADAIDTFLDPEYLNRVLRQLENGSDEPVEDVEKAIETVVSRPAFSKADTKGLLAAFMDSGQRTRGGLVQAITAYSQSEEIDSDRAYEMDADALVAAGFGNVSGLATA